MESFIVESEFYNFVFDSESRNFWFISVTILYSISSEIISLFIISVSDIVIILFVSIDW